MSRLSSLNIFEGITEIDTDIIEEAKEPMRPKKNNITWLKRVGQVAGGLAAAFVLMVGLCAASPALASCIPFFGDIVRYLGVGVVDEGTVTVKCDNIRYYDDWRQAGIADEDMRAPVGEYEELLADGENTFVLFDVTVETKGVKTNPEVDMDKITAADKKDGDSVYWITSLVEPRSEKNAAAEGWTIDYFSQHGVGESDYFHFAQGSTETKTMQVGVFVPTDVLQTGDLVLCLNWNGVDDYETKMKVPPVN